MTIFPLAITQIFGTFGSFLVYLAIGFAFGYALEIAGFGNSKKLAAQFYFKEMTVLKVMFTAIVVAMVLIFAASAVGLLDYNLIWVNPTYMWPGIVGGLIMGVGFIIGGFCPGTSLVALATAKIDGIFFALGVLFGIFIFGESVQNFDIFFNSSYMGRFTLPELFGVSTGWVVLGVVLMALFMFWGSEQLEKIFGGIDPKQAPRARYYGAGALVVLAGIVLMIGQPSNTDRWERIEPEMAAKLANREVQIHPGELLDTIHDTGLKTVMLDARSEVDYNLFHIADAELVDQNNLPELISNLHLEPANTVIVVMSNDEAAATELWKYLVAESVPNVYILDGGVNNWIATFAEEESRIHESATPSGDDQLSYEFVAALGGSYPSADPHPEEFVLEYEKKIQLELKRAPTGGGCG